MVQDFHTEQAVHGADEAFHHHHHQRHPHTHHPLDEELEQYARFQAEPPPPALEERLQRAMAQYLRTGVVSDDVGLEARASLAPAALFERAAHSVSRAFPQLGPAAVERKAVEVLHNLDLDECHGRPHPGSWLLGDWGHRALTHMRRL